MVDFAAVDSTVVLISFSCIADSIDPAIYGSLCMIKLGVEVLENEDDPRYNYFNNKIHALVMKKSVLEQLHKVATGSAPDPHAIEQAQLLELEKRKSEYELQMTLQKDQYTVSSIKDMIRKGENHTQRKNKRIQENIEEQNTVL